MFDGPLAYIIGGLLICAASFFVTLMLTQPQQIFEGPPVQQRIERLLQARIFSQSALEKQADSVGLFPSNGLRTVIDSATRRADGRVVLVGWAANPSNEGTPIALVAFVKGKGVLLGGTKGAREDVTRALHLPELAARNVAINQDFICPSNDLFVFVAIDESGGFSALRERYCP